MARAKAGRTVTPVKGFEGARGSTKPLLQESWDAIDAELEALGISAEVQIRTAARVLKEAPRKK